jgi:hypothetical protein
LDLVCADIETQLQESSFGEWFAFDPHFYVVDCRLSRGREMGRMKTALVACHRALSLRPEEVPMICSVLLDKLKGLRERHRSDPIITVAELLRTLDVYSEADLVPVCDSICR